MALVGLFVISEILVLLEREANDRSTAISDSWIPDFGELDDPLGMARGSVTGFASGVLPGAGASLGSVVCYPIET